MQDELPCYRIVKRSDVTKQDIFRRIGVLTLQASQVLAP